MINGQSFVPPVYALGQNRTSMTEFVKILQKFIQSDNDKTSRLLVRHLRFVGTIAIGFRRFF